MTNTIAMWLGALGLSTLVHGCGEGIVGETDISYDGRFGVAKLDIYQPASTTLPGPAVVLIHGGAWREGSTRSDLTDHALRLAEAGYVAVNIDYRVTPTGGEFPHAVQDCLCALSFVRANADRFGIDPDRIAAYGYSAGGHLASMLGTAARDPVVAPDCAVGATGPAAAVVSGAGPQDMMAMPEVSPVIAFVGGTKAAVPERYAQASPINHVAAGAPPYLLITGDDDWFVDAAHSHRMAAALDAVGTEARLLEIPGGGHVLNRGASGTSWDVELAIDTPEAWAATIDFLDRTIGEVAP